ncbi:ECF transporter S component [Dellaglioa algida]|uniref:Riboflavin transporter n=1 Tax=Dellaglioa algida TaxID=105612 RepID=A0A2C8ELF2_9LACO|nr:ECF transporter S component [Dellaglioa algida]MDK1716507.1 ECF transporter S component [Dellaglioa algida]MDK1718070.1 ECF transporter S component [Dellaglioa algida]MDK1720000.1 ECF transporter S component [Dellaglioa algida]MDK1721449.1 ECF transporter S component [Dellaglioa algida]MDK1723329.1 ECF transporter S component [Dellaglioa algida]
MNRSPIFRVVITAFLAAISYVLMFLSFPVIPLIPYLKIDFSDLPILIGFFILGPLGGVMVAIVRSLLYLVSTGTDIASLIGVGTNFLASMAVSFPAYYILKGGSGIKPTIWKSILTILTSTLVLTVLLSIANYFVILPVYLNVIGMDIGMSVSKYVVIGVIPFNIIKGILVVGVFSVLYRRMYSWVQLNNKKYKKI